MIEVTACRDLTDKEKRKLELEEQIKQLEEEKSKLDSNDDDADNTIEVNGIKIAEADKLDADILTETMMAAEIVSGLLDKSSDDAKDISELTAEEEEIVSRAISKDNNNIELTDEQLKEIKRATEREYNSIKASNKPKNILLYVALAIAAMWIFISAFGAINSYRLDSMDSIKDFEHITVPVK